jgi:hypothetical protein
MATKISQAIVGTLCEEIRDFLRRSKTVIPIKTAERITETIICSKSWMREKILKNLSANAESMKFTTKIKVANLINGTIFTTQG